MKSEWSMHEEREVAPGVYAKLALYVHPWTLWLFETKRGKSWTLGQAAAGKAAVRPIGIEAAVGGGIPYITVNSHQTPKLYLFGSHPYGVRMQIRTQGERFFSDFCQGAEPHEWTDKRVDVVVTSFASERSNAAYAKDEGSFDLDGMTRLIDFGQTLIS